MARIGGFFRIGARSTGRALRNRPSFSWVRDGRITRDDALEAARRYVGGRYPFVIIEYVGARRVGIVPSSDREDAR